RLALVYALFALLELGEQLERLLRGLAVAGALAVHPLALLAQPLLPRGERGLAVDEHPLARVVLLGQRRLLAGEHFDALLQSSALAGLLGRGSLRRRLALGERALAAEQTGVQIAQRVLARGHAGFRLAAVLLERTALALQLAFALCD